MAGGMLNDANNDKVNLAKKCKDGTQVNVPFLSAKQKKEKEQDVAYIVAASRYKALSEGSLQVNEGNAITDKVNLNTADQKRLESLPGIGPAMAFVAYALILWLFGANGKLSRYAQIFFIPIAIIGWDLLTITRPIEYRYYVGGVPMTCK